MPPKPKITVEMIVDAAVEVVRQSGFENINARTVSGQLHCSTQPVMYHFSTIDSRNPYPAQAYMVVADDSVREWGKQDWAAKSADYLAMGYIPISMKNNFAQIYPEGIVPAEEQYHPAEALDQAA